jgi:elongation factor 1-alpha
MCLFDFFSKNILYCFV